MLALIHRTMTCPVDAIIHPWALMFGRDVRLWFLPLPDVHDGLGSMLETLVAKKGKLKSRRSPANRKTMERMTGLSWAWTNDDWWQRKPPLHRRFPHRVVHRQPWTEGFGLYTSDIVACYTACLKNTSTTRNVELKKGDRRVGRIMWEVNIFSFYEYTI